MTSRYSYSFVAFTIIIIHHKIFFLSSNPCTVSYSYLFPNHTSDTLLLISKLSLAKTVGIEFNDSGEIPKEQKLNDEEK